MALATLLQCFNFEFQDIKAAGPKMQSDGFILGRKAKSHLKCIITLYET